MDKFRCISGFSDTLLLFRSCFPELKGQYSLGKLYQHFLGKKYDAHNALGDVKALNELMIHCKISADELLNYSFTMKYVISSGNFHKAAHSRYATLLPIVASKKLSKSMAKKISDSGLTFHHLLAANKRELNGIRSVLTERFNRKPRVTSSSRVISSIKEYFISNCYTHEL